MFKPGDKVVCLDDVMGSPHLVRGAVYTIQRQNIAVPTDWWLEGIDTNSWRGERFALISNAVQTNDAALQKLRKLAEGYSASPETVASLINTRLCTCDFHTVILRTGCACGGK